MAYNEELASRIRTALAHREAVTEKKMFGGLTFMVDGKMCCGVQTDDLMIRVSVEEYERALAQPHTRPMDFTGKPFPGFLYVGPGGYERDEDLQSWLLKAITYATSLPSKATPKKSRK